MVHRPEAGAALVHPASLSPADHPAGHHLCPASRVLRIGTGHTAAPYEPTPWSEAYAACYMMLFLALDLGQGRTLPRQTHCLTTWRHQWSCAEQASTGVSCQHASLLRTCAGWGPGAADGHHEQAGLRALALKRVHARHPDLRPQPAPARPPRGYTPSLAGNFAIRGAQSCCSMLSCQPSLLEHWSLQATSIGC